MTQKPQNLVGNAFIWQGLQLVGGKAIYFLRLIILARLLSPDDFGLMAIAVSAVGILMSVTNLGMVPALVQGQEIDEEAYHVAWTIRLSRAFLVTLAVFLAAPLIAALFSEPRATDIIRVLAFRPFLDALASIKIAGLTRKLHFQPLTLLSISQALLNTAVSIILAQSYGVWALVFGTLAGAVWYSTLSYVVAPYRPRLSFERETTQSLIHFGRWIFVTSLIAMAGSYVLRVTISRQLGTADLGLYYLAAQIAFLPAEIASEVVGAVAFPLYARLQTNLTQVAHTFRMIFTGTVALLYPACAMIIALAPTLVNDVLGPDWQGTVPVIRILTLATMIGMFGEVTGPVFSGLGQPRRVTLIEAIQSIIIILSVWWLAGAFGLVGAAFAWMPAIITSQFVSAVFMRQMLEKPFQGLRTPILTIIAVSVVGALIAYGVDQLAPGLIGFVAACVVGVAATGLLLWVFDRRFGLGFVRDLALLFPQLSTVLGYKNELSST
jgi:O-antigen/teichoic acid export membrane protein